MAVNTIYKKLQSMEQILNNHVNSQADRYENTGIRTRVIREICALAKEKRGEKVVLFGSRARGDFKERSDIDLAFRGGNGSEFASATTGSPRMIIKTAYQAGMIQDEQVWMEALISRNNVSHSYNQNIAEDIINKAKSNYVDMFRELLHIMETSWL